MHKHIADSTQRYFHTLSSKISRSNEILVITGYDYFLQKNDLGHLLKKYNKIVLIPRSVKDAQYLGSEIGRLINKHEKIHLINNPAYDYQHRIIYQMVLVHGQSKVIRTSSVSVFCVNALKKIYVPESVEDSTVIDSPNVGFSFGIKIIKRTIDLCAATALLFVTAPISLYAYFRIKEQSPGPVFYKQKRVGLQEHEFDCIKFRSMQLDAEVNGAQFSSKNDHRIFDFGRTMRATRIDELPQMLNIFKGEMSLIGPRPERKAFTDTFDETVPHYNTRHAVKPGLSGYAQVMYSYGSSVSDARHKLMYDLYYIKHWSLWLELSVVFNTFWTVVAKRGV